jgi:hypothetical protein
LILLGCGTFQKSPPESSGGCALDNFKAVPPRRLVGSGVVENRIDVKRDSGLMSSGAHIVSGNDELAQAIYGLILGAGKETRLVGSDVRRRG